MRHAVAALLASMVAVACVDEPREPAEIHHVTVERKLIPLAGPRKLDLLFVVDASAAMAPYAERLLDNAPALIDALDALPTGRPDLHLAVTISDPAAGGAFQFSRGGTSREEGFFTDLRLGDGARVTNYGGDLRARLASVLLPSRFGDVATEPLGVIDDALEAHPEFLRRDAHLYVVILTARADTSGVLGGDVAQWLGDVTGNEGQVSVALVAPPAVHAGQLAALLAALPERNAYVSLDEADLSVALAPYAALHRMTLGLACFQSPVIEASCGSWLEYEDPRTARTISPCVAGLDVGACFQITTDPTLCTEADGQYVTLVGAAADAAVRWGIECVTR